MAIDPVGTSASSLSALSTPSNSSKEGGNVSKNEFLKMLVAQLEHQNPLNPQDGAAFVAQLAQFSQLEQAAETNSRLVALQASADAQSRTALMGLVGKTITARADQFTLSGNGGAPPTMALKLDGASAKTQVTLRDSAGNAVRTLDLGAHAAGQVTVAWPPGFVLGPGTYRLEVSAKDAKGGTVTSSTELQGSVDALEFQNGSPRLRVGSIVLQPSDVLSVLGGGTPATAATK